MYPVDFCNAFEQARLRINTWVEKQTNERIRDLIARGALNKHTRLMLTNAIYFKGGLTFKISPADVADFMTR